MQRTLNIGIGAGAVLTTRHHGGRWGIGGVGRAPPAANLTIALVSKHINRAQAQDIAPAEVPRSRPTDVESDDLRDHPVGRSRDCLPQPLRRRPR